MRHKLLLTLVFLLLCGGALKVDAQVQIRVNGSEEFVINETNGLYFHNDTMFVDDAAFALDDIQVITFTQITQNIDDIADAAMQLMPNPATDAVMVQGIGDTPQTVIIYSLAGIKLHEQMATDGTRIDISKLPDGLYLLRCGDKVSKIVKQ